MDHPFSTCPSGRKTGIAPGYDRLVLGLLVIVGLLTAAPAAASVELPGPLPINVHEGSTCALAVSRSDNEPDWLLIGNGLGALQLYDFRAGVELFSSWDQLPIDGLVVDMIPWRGYDGPGFGVVAATKNNDQLVFLVAQTVEPYFQISDVVPLTEDPGSLVYVGDLESGPEELAVSLPGVDQVAFFRRTVDGWQSHAILETGDRPRRLAALDLDDEPGLELVAVAEGFLSRNLTLMGRDSAGDWELTGHRYIDGGPSDLVSVFDPSVAQEVLLVALADSNQVALLESVAGELVERQRVSTILPPGGLLSMTFDEGRRGAISWHQERGFVESFVLDTGQLLAHRQYYVGCRPANADCGDFNGDGLMDVVFTGDGEDDTQAVFGRPDREFWAFPALALPDAPGLAEMADFDADGFDDLLVANLYRQDLCLFTADGRGLLQGLPRLLDVGFLPSLTTVADCDGDLTPEFVAYDRTGTTIHVYELDQALDPVELGTVASVVSPRGLAAGDCDGDGFTDLAATLDGDGEVEVYFGDGTGGFPQRVSRTFGARLWRLLLVDISADGRADLVGVDGTSRIWTSVAQADRSFSTPTWVNAGVQPLMLAAADLDGDADLDFVTGNRNGESLTFLENQGSGVLTLRLGNVDLGDTPLQLAVSELNGDENPDVVVIFPNSGEVGVAFGGDNWTYGLPALYAGAAQPRDVKLSDFDLDLRDDILTIDQDLNLGVIMLNLERVLVGVETEALSVGCNGDRLQIRIAPGRTEVWRLDIGADGAWRALARPGQAYRGDLQALAEAWVLDLDAAELDVLRDHTLRLTVGEGAAAESLDLQVPVACLGDGNGPAHRLAWQREPWPNPFNPRMQASFALTRADHVTASVHDLAGRQVTLLVDREFTAGVHQLTWNGRAGTADLAAGVYLLRVRSSDAVLSRKLLLLK